MPASTLTFDLPSDAPRAVLWDKCVDLGNMVGKGFKIFGEGRVEQIVYLSLY